MAAKDNKTANYKTLMTVRHDGKNYAKGLTLSLTGDQAEQLLKIKAIAEIADKAAEKEAK